MARLRGDAAYAAGFVTFVERHVRLVKAAVGAIETEVAQLGGPRYRAVTAKKHFMATEPLTSVSPSRDRERLAERHAAIYVREIDPLRWVISEVERSLEDLWRYTEGLAVPKRDMPALDTERGAIGPRSDRAPRAQLAAVITHAAKPTPSSSPERAITDAVQWGRVMRAAELSTGIRDTLEASIDGLVALFDVPGAVSDYGTDRSEAMSLPDRIALSELMMTVLPLTKAGRAYKDRLASPPSSTHAALYQRSPVHDSFIADVIEAVDWDGTAPDVKIVSNAALLRRTSPASSPAKLANDLTSRAGTVVDVYSRYVAVAGAWSSYRALELPVGSSERDRLVALFTPGTKWPEPDDTVPAGLKSKLAAWKLISATTKFFATVESESRKSSWGPQEVVAVAKDGAGLAEAVVEVATLRHGPVDPSSVSPTTRALRLAQAARVLAVLNVAFAVLDLAFAAKAFANANDLQSNLAAGLQAGGGTISLLSVTFGVMRSVPHPVAVAAGILGALVCWTAGKWQVHIQRQQIADLLRQTVFSEEATKVRRARATAWANAQGDLHQQGKDAAAAGIQGPRGNGQGYEDVRYALLRKEGERWVDDLELQIAVALGAVGALPVTYTAQGGGFKVDVGRKLPRFNGQTSTSPLNQTLLPAGSTLRLGDATHGQVNDGRDGGALNHPAFAVDLDGISAFHTAADDAIGHKDGGFFAQGNSAQWVRPIVLEFELTMASPAWDAGIGGTAPDARIIVRTTLP